MAPRPFPEVSLSQERSEVSNADGPRFHSLEPWARVKASDVHTAAAGTHVLTHESTEVPVAFEDAGSCKVSAHPTAGGVRRCVGRGSW